MSYGTGRSDLEVRVLNLEQLVSAPRLQSVETRVAAVEQQQWATSGGGGNGSLIMAVRTATTPTGGIPAKSGSTCGSATCTFENIDPATGVISTAETNTVFNRFISVVGATAGTAITVGWCVNLTTGQGCWVAISEDC